MLRPRILSTIELQAAVRQLQRLHRRWRRSHHADDLYVYLSRVYRLFGCWQKEDVAERAARRILAMSGICSKPSAAPIARDYRRDQRRRPKDEVKVDSGVTLLRLAQT